ncbi:MAG: winged helix-turn-helix domain-containing protein [Saprospiraceae bacterium]
MKQWMLRLTPAIGLVLILVMLTSVLWPQPLPDTHTNALAVRQVGHDYLRAVGDSTSLIPAVRDLGEGKFVLPLGRCIDYDELIEVSKRVMRHYAINLTYTLALEDDTSGKVFLGSLFYPPANEELAEAASAACSERDREDRPANIRITFVREDETAGSAGLFWLGGLGFFLLVAAPLVGRITAPKAGVVSVREDTLPLSEMMDETQRLLITPTLLLDESALLLVIDGDEQTVTYREAKLLAYLAKHPNEVLERIIIHDAVWGEEGIITGRSLDVFVSRLRKKLAAAEEVEIQTVHGVGYRFRVGGGSS